MGVCVFETTWSYHRSVSLLVIVTLNVSRYEFAPPRVWVQRIAGVARTRYGHEYSIISTVTRRGKHRERSMILRLCSIFALFCRGNVRVINSRCGYSVQRAGSCLRARRLRTGRSHRPTTPASTHATPSATISSTAATTKRSTSRFRTSTSKAFHRSKQFCVFGGP